MYVIQPKDVSEILGLYCKKETISNIDLLQYYYTENKICMVILAETVFHNSYVIKILDKNSVSVAQEELQSAFSELLRTHGLYLCVPQKYKSNNNVYGTIINFYSHPFYVTVEEYFGKDVKVITPQSTAALGALLAKIHSISMKCNCHLPYGATYHALTEKRVSMQTIWKNANQFNLHDELFSRITSIHHKQIDRLAQIWKDLPYGAVHGDLGLTSNLMLHRQGFGVIDFNLAGDEIFLSDLLITWYSSRYNVNTVMMLSTQTLLCLKKIFFDSYLENRSFTENEKIHFKEMACILNGIYFNRFVAEIARIGFVKPLKHLFPLIEGSYFKSDININLQEILQNELPHFI